jgi:hypothetical protein
MEFVKFIAHVGMYNEDMPFGHLAANSKRPSILHLAIYIILQPSANHLIFWF